jgi:NAD(P)-dependent dehydrogenase (short-subunit alcohol dehydrogenase family)
MTLAIDNARSSIAQELLKILGEGTEYIMDPCDPYHERFLFCGGFLKGSEIAETSRADVSAAWHRNFADIAAQCDIILAHNAHAKICIVGSESGFAGSYDMAYAGAKAAMHLYIEKKKLLTPEQQLVGIAPTVIWDSGMTQRRTDLEECEAKGKARRRGRWLLAHEVARVAHFLLYQDEGAISNTVIRVTGGNW